MWSASAERIAWDELARAAKAEGTARLAKVAESWNFRSKQEHLAVGAFSTIANELASEGCEPVVLSLITRAANDEVRHAETCSRMWSALRGATFEPARFRGTPMMPAFGDATPATRVLLHVAELCCISETFTGVAFTEMMTRTTHPVARAVVQSLLRDELDHGRVGWAYLAERSRLGTLDGLAEALPELLDRAMGAGIRPAEGVEPDDVSLERWAYLGPKAVAEIFRAAAREVVLPGFDLLGVNTKLARAKLAALGWA